MSEMTGSDIALIITACGTFLTAAVSGWGALIANRNSKKLQDVHELTKQVKEETNGMKDELIRTTQKASYAEGVKSETDKHGH